IRTYDITMWLSGRVEDLTIRLSSEPPLPQEDLLALVTAGSTRAALGSSRAPPAERGSAGPGQGGLDSGRAGELRRLDVCRRSRSAHDARAAGARAERAPRGRPWVWQDRHGA